jgi:chromosomal replication initiation ATPase DnaA
VNEVKVNGEIISAPARRPIHEIQRQVCLEFGITKDELLGPSRKAQNVEARHTGMYLAKAIPGATFPKIGRAFRRDHTTVIYAVRKIAARLTLCIGLVAIATTILAA